MLSSSLAAARSPAGKATPGAAAEFVVPASAMGPVARPRQPPPRAIAVSPVDFCQPHSTMGNHDAKALCGGVITLAPDHSERVQGCVMHVDADLARKPNPLPNRNLQPRARPNRRRNSNVGPETRGGPCVSHQQPPDEMVLVLLLVPGGRPSAGQQRLFASAASAPTPLAEPRPNVVCHVSKTLAAARSSAGKATHGADAEFLCSQRGYSDHQPILR
jgi:hypothetical protein